MRALQETLDTLYQRHMEHTRNLDWGYHQLLPWERGKNFMDHPWTAGEGSLPNDLTLAVETAMLTEINLPWFTSGLTGIFEQSPNALKRFVHTWTREEDQHGRVLDVYLLLSRNGDPAQRDKVRKHVLEVGWKPELRDPFGVMIYTSLQELATRVFYLNLAKKIERWDQSLTRILRSLAKDETLHYAFYRDAVKAYLEEDPGRMAAMCRVIPTFVMPGYGMPDFTKRLRVIAQHAGYGISAYYEQVLKVVMEAWGISQHDPSSDTREDFTKLERYVNRIRRLAHRESVAISTV